MAKQSFKFDKLIRDKILDMMLSTNCIVHNKKLEGTELVTALKNKLLEEAHEVAATKSVEELKEELADLLEVVYTILSTHKLELAEIEEIREIKKLQKGSFTQGIYVSSIEIDENNPEINRYLAKSDKYPKQIDFSGR
ncbi:MAG: nucleoside triphosphate pyrophosphohydrolase [Candidatus Babeliales bacterium]|jgi:predicted house-cleaning noncanonical NTP pyrophosphatase (MazG superfamily)